jgi:hypothetical protein
VCSSVQQCAAVCSSVQQCAAVCSSVWLVWSVCVECVCGVCVWSVCVECVCGVCVWSVCGTLVLVLVHTLTVHSPQSTVHSPQSTVHTLTPVRRLHTQVQANAWQRRTAHHTHAQHCKRCQAGGRAKHVTSRLLLQPASSQRVSTVPPVRSHAATQPLSHPATQPRSHAVTQSRSHSATQSQSHAATQSHSHAATQPHTVTQSRSHSAAEPHCHTVTQPHSRCRQHRQCNRGMKPAVSPSPTPCTS